ncbi:MAG: glutamyl-tRNA reductase [Bdellovibrionota bacterium]
MSFFLIGVNHETADVSVREKLAWMDQETEQKKVFSFIQSKGSGVLLSTCNRVEWYLNVPHPQDALECKRHFFPDIHETLIYEKQDMEAISHLCRVASSLDSQVVGEPQVLGQVKRAYHKAKQFEAVDPELDLIFQKSFLIAKKIRTETKIGQSFVSMSSVAIDLAKKVVGHFSDKEALVIGAGEMSTLAAKKLSTEGIGRLWIANRTYDQAVALAKIVDGYPMLMEQIYDHLEDIDIVFVCTGAQKPLITKDHVIESLGTRSKKPIMMIDISVPRNIEKNLGEIENIYVYDVDDLKGIALENEQLRKSEIEKAEKILIDHLDRFEDVTRQPQTNALIKNIKLHVEELAQMECEKISKKLHLDQDQEKILQRGMSSLAKKWVDSHIQMLKTDGIEATQALHLFSQMFSKDSDES